MEHCKHGRAEDLCNLCGEEKRKRKARDDRAWSLLLAWVTNPSADTRDGPRIADAIYALTDAMIAEGKKPTPNETACEKP